MKLLTILTVAVFLVAVIVFFHCLRVLVFCRRVCKSWKVVAVAWESPPFLTFILDRLSPSGRFLFIGGPRVPNRWLFGKCR